ncbi:hypothetical protein H9Q13_08045 [Pontibacter sp. JH31]|uniref:Outer membrane protein beta-barrel domain-containing protein n=1 Tax=Pontibacter aquaedesilientis TaxID=2766980 RepID=A0ABR7XFN8_9BACT|nr:hypothetical protein [Pontibacter aquaedesilientis]MBD1397114.1 hypothetical protein [Pontibacter aquaedesilientis]
MRRTFSVILLVLALAASATAQDIYPLGQRIGLQLGSAVPIGDFSKDRFEDEFPPMASKGTMVQGSYARDLKPGIAWGVTAGWRWNRFDLDRFAQEDDELVMSRRASAWQSGFVLADLYLQSKVQRFFGYVKGSVGGAYSQSPDLQVNTSYGPIARTPDSAVSIAYGLAGGIGVQAKQVNFSMEIGTLASRPTFEVSDAQGQRFRYKQSMQTVHVNLGVSYTL